MNRSYSFQTVIRNSSVRIKESDTPLLFTLKGEPAVEFAVYRRSQAGRIKWIQREKNPANRL